MICDAVFLSVDFGAGVGFGPIGRMREPATQQLKRRPPRIKKLPLQPNFSKNHVFKGARVERKTGLPAMASPLAIGRFLKKYFPIIVRAGLRLKASPKPAKGQKEFYFFLLYECTNAKVWQKRDILFPLKYTKKEKSEYLQPHRYKSITLEQSCRKMQQLGQVQINILLPS